MKTLVFVLCVMLLAVGIGSAQTYQVQGPSTLNCSRNYGAANQGTGWRYSGGSSLTAYSTSKSGVYIFGAPLQSSPYKLEWGYADNSGGTGFVPQLWFMGTLLGSGDSPRGQYMPDGTMADMNGTPVDPVTGVPLDTPLSKVGFDLINPWADRWSIFEVDEHDLATGAFLGTRTYEVGPGETLNVTLGRTYPFTATPYLMVDGTRNSHGGPYTSSGGPAGGGTSSEPVEQVGAVGTTAPVDQPAAVTGTTETKLAVDRVGTIIANMNQDMNQIGGQTNRGLADINGSVKGVQAAIEGMEAGGGGLTAGELGDALQNGTPAGDDLGDGGVQDGLDEGDAAAGEIPGVRTSLSSIGTSLGDIIDAVGLGASYGTDDLEWSISVPVFGAIHVDAEQYSWLWDIIRQVTLWMFSIMMVGKFIKGAREAIA